jgi:hypothetical protein
LIEMINNSQSWYKKRERITEFFHKSLITILSLLQSLYNHQVATYPLSLVLVMRALSLLRISTFCGMPLTELFPPPLARELSCEIGDSFVSRSCDPCDFITEYQNGCCEK